MSALHQKDFYKVGHVHQYPKNTTTIYANLTPRSGTHCNVPNQGGVYFVGLQKFLQEYLIDDWNKTFFQKPLDQVLERYLRIVKIGLNSPDFDVSHIKDLHKLGYLPIEIKSLDEGSFVPYGVPVLTIRNTISKFYWVPNMLETVLCDEIWLPITSATTYMWFRKNSLKFSTLTCENDDHVPFQNHDFSMRGMQCRQSAATSGFASIACGSMGTDTIPAIDIAYDYYGAKGFVAGSIPASEHSVMCSGGKDDEFETYKRFLTEIYPTGLVSIVSDTWDFWGVISEFLPKLKPEIMRRDGKLVIRPDSGDPVEIICGTQWVDIDKYYENQLDISIKYLKYFAKQDIECFVSDNTPHGQFGDTFVTKLYKFNNKFYNVTVEIDWNRYDKQYYYIDGSDVTNVEEIELSPEQKGLIQCLWETFGGSINSKGYKVLDSHIGAIYGDSINWQRHEQILTRLMNKGFAASNIVFGIGSYTYTMISRDTHGLAMKSTYVEINGVGQEIFKDPKTDNGAKKSAKGLLKVVEENGSLKLLDQVSVKEEKEGLLTTVFKDGIITRTTTLEQIRNKVNQSLGN